MPSEAGEDKSLHPGIDQVMFCDDFERMIRFLLGVLMLANFTLAMADTPTPRAAFDPPLFAFDRGHDLETWQRDLHRALRQTLLLPKDDGVPLQAAALQAAALPDSETADHVMSRIEFTAEQGERVPGYLLLPKTGEKPFPVMICLQGHAPGMHISIGRAKNAKEQALIGGGRDLALQAVRHGWAALVIEQRAFGERAKGDLSCQHAALNELLKGRSLTGQRVFDVSRAIDFIETRAELDSSRIGCIGNSTGGTVTFYAACVDPRIRLAVVSCAFGTFASTWLDSPHCACGYVPGVLKLADMPDLAGLIAPRHLLIVAGTTDNLARIDGVKQGVAAARRIFRAAGHEDRVKLLVGEGGHQFYPDLAWPVIQDVLTSWAESAHRK